ncbi:hypothetical protein FB107DRAFT_272461 [Schizophyllum commune]
MLGTLRRRQHTGPLDFLLHIFESLDGEDYSFAVVNLLDSRSVLRHRLSASPPIDARKDFSMEAFELGRTMRELPLHRATKRLRLMAREYLIWAAGFGLAEEAIHRCYSELRRGTRWASNPRGSDCDTTDSTEDRRILERLHTTLNCHIDLIEKSIPTSSPFLLVFPRLTRYLMPFSHLAAPRGLSNLVYQAFFHSFVTFVKYLKGENEPYEGYTRTQSNLFYGFLVLGLIAGSSVIGFLLNMGGCVDQEIKKRMGAASHAIHAFETGAREYISAWKALRAVVRALLDAHSLESEQERQIRVFFRAFDSRYARPARQSLTVLAAIHEKIILEDDRDALLAEINARFLAPAAAADIPASLDEEDEDDPLCVRPYGYVSRALKDIMARAFDELGLTDTLLKHRILCKSATWETARRDYFVAMSLLVDALAHLDADWPFLQPFLRNVHARLAWAGGVAHGLHSINIHVASWRDTLYPDEDDLRRFIRTLDHYIVPLSKGRSRLMSPSDLHTTPIRTKLQLVARETTRSIAYPLLFIPYAFTPRVNNWYARQAAYVLYARLLDYCVDNQSQNAIAGMFDYFFDYPDVVEIRRVKETVAQVEHTSHQLLVAWMTMRHAAQRTLETKHPGLLLDSLDLYSSSDIRSHSHFSCLGCSLPSLLKRLGPERATAIYEEVVELYPRLPGENRQMSSGQKRAREGFEGEDETVSGDSMG